VDVLGLGQLAELEERQPEEVSRTLVARLVAKRLLQRDPRLGGVAALERLGAGGERAVELLRLRQIGVVLVEDAAVVDCAGARFHHFSPATADGAETDASLSCFSRLSW